MAVARGSIISIMLWHKAAAIRLCAPARGWKWRNIVDLCGLRERRGQSGIIFQWKAPQFGGRSGFFVGPRDFTGKPEDHFS
jgi:hypothetical protein